MDEPQLRRYAEAALLLLPLMMPVDEAAKVRAQIGKALALPPGEAFFPLVTALSSDPVLRELIDLQQPPTQHRAPDHYLDVETQRRVPPGRRFSVHVSVTGTPRGRHDLLRVADPPRGELVVSLYAPGFAPTDDSDWRQTLPLPSGNGPSRIEFGLRSLAVGDAQEISVRAFAGGTQVGEVNLEIDVVTDRAEEEMHHVESGLPSLEPEDHDAILEVRRVGDLLKMRLSRKGTPGEAVPVGPVAGDALRWLTDELRVLAKAKDGPTERQLRLRHLGVELWTQLFPHDIREQLWSLPPEVTSLHVLAEGFALPFELLHPLDGGRDAGFLVERFDVARLAGGKTAARRRRARQAAFVRPVNSPKNAGEEFRRIGEALDAGTRVWPVAVTGPLEMNALLTLPTTLIHIAAHAEGSPALRFAGGRFDHRSLSAAIGEHSLAAVAPVVLFNSCDSAAELDGIIEPTDWGRRFIQAGAGAFVGTLWPVNSGAATTFAEAFHGHLAQAGSTVGEAMRFARMAVRERDGDAAWLAYTHYGDPRYGTA